MKKLAIAIAAVALIGTPAFAADMAVKMPVKAPPPAPPPIYNWTGWYVGGNIGAGFSHDQWSGQPVDFADALEPGGGDSFLALLLGSGLGGIGSHTDTGALGGFTVGYNYQFPGTPWVVGIEGEWMFANLKGAHTQDQTFSQSFGFVENGGAHERFSTNVDDLATIAVRFGAAFGPENRALWYVKGGGAWVRNSFSEDVAANAFFPIDAFTPVFAGSGTVHVNQWGWMVGTGLEWGILGNLSAKIEYEFLDFGTHDFTMPINGVLSDNFGDCPPCSITFNRNFSVQQQIHVIKFGLNYRFWGYY